MIDFIRTPTFKLYSIRHLIAWLGICCWLTACTNNGYDEILAKGIDKGFPAYVLGVQQGDHKPWIGSKGLASIENQRSVNPDDRFPIASLSKLFTAVTILKLVDQGLLSLHDKVLDHLNQAEVKAIPNIDLITVRQLLDHSSGIYAFNNDTTYLPTLIGPRRAENIQWTPLMFLELADSNRVAPLGMPGSGHYYGDTNYILLGLIIEKVTGQPLRTVVKKEVFQPMGLVNTAYIGDVDNAKKITLPATVEGYTKKSEILGTIIPMYEGFKIVNDSLYNTTIASERIDAAAGIVSTAGDLIKLATALYLDHFLSTESLAFLMSPGDNIEEAPDGEDRQGIVRALNPSYGKTFISSGDGPGVNTLLAFIPNKKLIIVSLTNMFGQFDEEAFVIEKIIPDIVQSIE